MYWKKMKRAEQPKGLPARFVKAEDIIEDSWD
jgi:hypothetical protein